MFRRNISLVFILAVVVQASFAPFSLIDDAKEKLEELRSSVLGAIFAAENDLDDMNTDLQVFASNSERTAILTVQSEEQTVNESLNELKSLAVSAGADISYCLQGRENYFNNLRVVILGDLNDCVFGRLTQGSKVLDEIKYLVDVTINAVNALDFQLDLCDPASEECLSLLLEQIELATEKVPQQIDLEVLKAEELFGELKVSVQQCGDVKISQYVSSANTILRDITQCVNAILG